MTTKRILHYPGSKWRLADWIVSFFPEHVTYLEPYFGSGAVLFSKNRSQIETINDIDGEMINLFTMIREQPDELIRLIELTPFSREEYDLSYEACTDELEQARRTLVRLWQGRDGKTAYRTGWRNVYQPKGSVPVKE